MADSNRPRPRPKPKPKQKSCAQVDSGSSTTPGASSSALASSSPKTQQIRDEDEHFMRNKKRTFTTWQQLEEINKETPRAVNSDSDTDEQSSPRSRKHKKTKHENDVPKWQKDKKFARLLSKDPSSDSDSDIEIIGSTPGPSAKRKKHARSRSRSITPPPAVPLHTIQNARNVVRQALDTGPRAASPTYFDIDDSTDTIILNPELERIAKSISSHPQLTTLEAQSENLDEVILTVKWQPHPLDEGGKEEMWMFKMNKDDNFRDLFEATAEDANILVKNLIMSYKGKRIFASVTPETLMMGDEVTLVACDITTYEYIRAHQATTTQPIDRNTPTFDISSDEDDGAPEPSTSQPQSQSQGHDAAESEAESESDGDKFKLILRSALTGSKDISLVVRSATKCGAIVKAFLKKAGLDAQYPNAGGGGTKSPPPPPKRGRKSVAEVSEKDPRLCVDGEKMANDAEIGDADLEDGDLVEVVGL
ncbi:hypothetical protein BDQ12DRAFT_680194 [Crucibulum laeve]|uniref:Rad60/SUMO-like domain-containing protein n=1 Tax=Crucibulum laeve TaxID=68775 RepID=A0A5C3MAQ9_9AGAR|nr:hypothetical protein BDQ12DRAFT_680194 [Crucibulum laeve]